MHFLTVPGAVLVACFVVALLAWHASSTQAAYAAGGGASAGHASKLNWCGDRGLPACPAADPGWITLSSEAPGTVANVIAHSRAFDSMESRRGALFLDLPMHVHALHPAPGGDYWTSDHWIVSARNTAGKEIGVFDYVYDQANHRIRFAVYGNLLPSDPRYGHAFPYVSMQSAMARLSVERGVQPLAGTQPELVFFPIDPAYLGPSAGPHQQWTAGGEFPNDPMWYVAGANGHSYLVGSDSHVYDPTSIPFAR